MNQEEAPLLGARLRQVREEKGLSRRDVARELHLSVAFLTSLEEDDYDRLPEPPFVKGYLRNYARFLGLSGEELAGQYQQRLDEDRRHRREEEAVIEPTPRPVPWRLPVLAVLVVVLVIAVGWWLWPSEPRAPEIDGQPDAVPGLERDSEAAPESEATPRASDMEAPDDAAPEAGAEPVLDGDENLDLGAASADQQSAPGDEAAAPVPAAGEPAADEDSQNGGAEAPRADHIAMEFSKVCWIKIVDASGATLSQGRQTAGSHVKVEGKAPFRVTIGDAAAVSSVSVNDASATLPSRRSGDVVRVTLP